MFLPFTPSPFASLVLRFVLVCTSVVLMIACGSGHGGSQIPTSQAPNITTQPSNQSTRVGQTATFSVVASGTAPLRYQWSNNGTVISGATGPSYTTPVTVPSDNGATFAVTVSNSVGSAKSSLVSLVVGPRAPKAGDWRFQGIDLPGPVSQGALFDILVPQTETYPNQLSVPMMVSAASGICYPGVAYDCSWGVATYKAPTGVAGLAGVYQTDVFTNLENDLDVLNSSNVVITGLDLESANQCFAVSALQLSLPGGLNLIRQWIAPGDLQAVATQLGLESLVVTALSFNAGQLYILSYGWRQDTSTPYEVSVVSATSDTFVSQGGSLAANGYIITAIGGDPTDGLLLVGTRVQGDSMPPPCRLCGLPGATRFSAPEYSATFTRNIRKQS